MANKCRRTPYSGLFTIIRHYTLLPNAYRSGSTGLHLFLPAIFAHAPFSSNLTPRKACAWFVRLLGEKEVGSPCFALFFALPDSIRLHFSRSHRLQSSLSPCLFRNTLPSMAVLPPHHLPARVWTYCCQILAFYENLKLQIRIINSKLTRQRSACPIRLELLDEKIPPALYAPTTKMSLVISGT